jgi:hypothetical protein
VRTKPSKRVAGELADFAAERERLPVPGIQPRPIGGCLARLSDHTVLIHEYSAIATVALWAGYRRRLLKRRRIDPLVRALQRERSITPARG